MSDLVFYRNSQSPQFDKAVYPAEKRKINFDYTKKYTDPYFEVFQNKKNIKTNKELIKKVRTQYVNQFGREQNDPKKPYYPSVEATPLAQIDNLDSAESCIRLNGFLTFTYALLAIIIIGSIVSIQEFFKASLNEILCIIFVLGATVLAIYALNKALNEKFNNDFFRYYFNYYYLDIRTNNEELTKENINLFMLAATFEASQTHTHIDTHDRMIVSRNEKTLKVNDNIKTYAGKEMDGYGTQIQNIWRLIG